MTCEVDRLSAAARVLPRSLAATLGPPLCVAIEGPNGAGKTRLCSLLTERMGWAYFRGVPAAWEHSTAKLHAIRDADWLASAMYFLSGTIETSRDARQSPTPVYLMDRSIWSTLAVHYAHDPSRLDVLLPLVDLMAGRVKAPDLTIVLEASPDTCGRRIAEKTHGERQFDHAAPASPDFFARERDFYHWLAGQWPKVTFIDADDCDAEGVFARAAAILRESLPC
jgi:thymidylate kinase